MKNTVIHILVFIIISAVCLLVLDNRVDTLRSLQDLYNTSQIEPYQVAYVSYRILMNSWYFGYFSLAIIIDTIVSLILAKNNKLKIYLLVEIVIDFIISFISYRYVQHNSMDIQREMEFQTMLFIVGGVLAVIYICINYYKFSLLRKRKI